jgi:hypothetical protein
MTAWTSRVRRRGRSTAFRYLAEDVARDRKGDIQNIRPRRSTCEDGLPNILDVPFSRPTWSNVKGIEEY